MSARNGKPKNRTLCRWAMLLVLLLCTMPLGACVTTSTATAVKTICEPWRPIRYASQNKQSARFAGPGLVTDLRTHNFTGKRLGCW